MSPFSDDAPPKRQIPPRGVKPNNVNSSGDKSLGQDDFLSAAKSAAFSTEKFQVDPALARLIEVWPSLPDPIRRAMLADWLADAKRLGSYAFAGTERVAPRGPGLPIKRRTRTWTITVLPPV